MKIADFMYYNNLCEIEGRNSGNANAVFLTDDEHFAVGVVEKSVRHIFIASENMDRNSALREKVAVARNCRDALGKVRFHARHRQRIPAQLVRRDGQFCKTALPSSIVNLHKRLMQNRRANAIRPRPPVVNSWNSKSSSRKLFGIKPERCFLRRILSNRQCARNCFGRKFIAESAVVFELFFAGRRCHKKIVISHLSVENTNIPYSDL